MKVKIRQGRKPRKPTLRQMENTSLILAMECGYLYAKAGYTLAEAKRDYRANCIIDKKGADNV